MAAALSRQTLPTGSLVGASAPPTPGIVHLGLGQFHRAHAAVYTALAMAAETGDWGIVGVANRSPRVIDAMRAQDNLYSVLELAPGTEHASVVDVHRGLLVASDQGDDVTEAIAAPSTKIVTLTITEGGYHTSPAGGLDIADPAIAADLAAPDNAKTPLGLLVRGLVARWRQNSQPLSVLSCDNMLAAGHTTHDRVIQFLQAGDAPSEVLDWVETSVTFPNAMVDRIVPGTTDVTRDAVQRILGVRDEVPVPAEKFTMWVLEDAFAAGRPAWEKAGAIFTDEVNKYEFVKLRLLNGGYSLLANLGVLSGEATNPGAIAIDYIAECLRAAQVNEYLPTLDLPHGFDVTDYMDDLFERWANTALNDATWRVATDSSLKLAQRIVVPGDFHMQRGVMPQQLALTAAAWICVSCPPPGFDPGPVAQRVVEPKLAAMQAAVAGAGGPRDHALRVMRAGILPDLLTRWDAFDERVADFVETIAKDGVEAAAREALTGRTAADN
ncbi:MAG: mannitol dehydrogenase family protein [Propionibacteriaceae bacterium]|nr:mannitol dehydrogenase family protein [Propionibacteriaceae bacterium]